MIFVARQAIVHNRKELLKPSRGGAEVSGEWDRPAAPSAERGQPTTAGPREKSGAPGATWQPPIDIYDPTTGEITRAWSVRIDGPSELRYSLQPLLSLSGGRTINLAIATDAPIEYTTKEGGEWQRLPTSN